jgi:hypothetical protein
MQQFSLAPAKVQACSVYPSGQRLVFIAAASPSTGGSLTIIEGGRQLGAALGLRVNAHHRHLLPQEGMSSPGLQAALNGKQRRGP